MRSRSPTPSPDLSRAPTDVENVLSDRRLRSPPNHWERTSVTWRTSQSSAHMYVPDPRQPLRHRHQPISDPTALHQPEPDDVEAAEAGQHQPPETRPGPAHLVVDGTQTCWTSPAVGAPQAASGSGERLT